MVDNDLLRHVDFEDLLSQDPSAFDQIREAAIRQFGEDLSFEIFFENGWCLLRKGIVYVATDQTGIEPGSHEISISVRFVEDLN